ncbi:YolD-like family protein [Paenibacillus zanthoxyli]|uniref:YolD-like family protein n=1 Tax=Paenibacillus zanthoxyli TaxID=369399 RepID=UPI0004709C75|nr:YolD-like family protein [Paenibacillus zanthoxyli]
MTAIPKPSTKRKTDDRPKLDEFTQQEIAEQLQEAKENDKPIIVMVWKYGTVQGTVEKLDGDRQQIHIKQGHDDIVKVPFRDILKVENPAF